MTDAGTSTGRPREDEIEVVLLGPGYGESIVLHLGYGSWVIVDSCINTEGRPRALEYLDSIGVNAGQQVDLVVATHWHDDHIRGMETLVEVCNRADFCCANTLLNKEILAAIDALEARHLDRGRFRRSRNLPRFEVASFQDLATEVCLGQSTDSFTW